MQGEQLMDLDGYEKGYAHGWRDGRAEAQPDRPEPIDEERLARALHKAYCRDNRPMHSHPLHSADAILAAYRTEPGETMTHTDYTLVDD